MAFTDDVWQAAAGLRAAVHAHPFNQELAAGSLSRSAFAHYMIQDGLYLQGYARVLALGAAKAPAADEILAFSKAAEVAIVVERALHAGYLDQFGIDPRAAETATPTPACEAYVNFMLAIAVTDSFAVLAAAVLPCFWLYQDVGTAIAAKGAPGNFYQAWIDTYADENFAAATERMKGIVNAAAADAGPSERERMTAAFLRCAQHEWLFWDSAYHERDWPIKP
ncbi:aminopyrimidine aminohydrolase [Candidatus Phycosocius bacilliformis]|uniref:Aminopyrimidine aminohydrolase n=1 Tax=Candidatus Phycosocius bacilliformis TaxID=1445552 RepID=A0A2P2E8B0_9PROT|nr:thiaminase II [Candidatus Phycosocius bacilliformis]GBF57302.1 aminopyrimidine aminohydrolase [Candidatus Phycosocius bacilliformis]